MPGELTRVPTREFTDYLNGFTFYFVSSAKSVRCNVYIYIYYMYSDEETPANTISSGRISIDLASGNESLPRRKFFVGRIFALGKLQRGNEFFRLCEPVPCASAILPSSLPPSSPPSAILDLFEPTKFAALNKKGLSRGLRLPNLPPLFLTSHSRGETFLAGISATLGEGGRGKNTRRHY